jgi:hypothetical protein
MNNALRHEQAESWLKSHGGLDAPPQPNALHRRHRDVSLDLAGKRIGAPDRVRERAHAAPFLE